jgi:hypothetical protein
MGSNKKIKILTEFTGSENCLQSNNNTYVRDHITDGHNRAKQQTD